MLNPQNTRHYRFQRRRLEEGAAALEEEEQAQRLALAEISRQEEKG